MMLALATTSGCAILDATSIKTPPPSVPYVEHGTQHAVSVAWASDNASLYIASPNDILRYDLASRCTQTIHLSEVPVSSMLFKSNNTLIYSALNKVHVLECGMDGGRVAQTFDSQKSPISCMSLSNDRTLLASVSSSAVHVHNIALGSFTALRGTGLCGETNSPTCIFHTHSKTRLLIGIGSQVLLYDTVRPSTPLKSITLSEPSSGNVISIACSPFSKSLIAAATSGGYVALLDLEKEKALFRTANVKTPLTSVAFSQEGAAIYLGTESGKLLILDLRGLDKPPKSVSIGTAGSKIEALSVQKKLRTNVFETTTKSTAPAGKTTKSLASGINNAKKLTPVTPTPKFKNKNKAPSGQADSKGGSGKVDMKAVISTVEQTQSATHVARKASISSTKESSVGNESDLSVDLATLGSPDIGRRKAITSTIAKGPADVHKSVASTTASISSDIRTARPKTASSKVSIPQSKRPSSSASHRSYSHSPAPVISNGSQLSSPDLPKIVAEEPMTPHLVQKRKAVIEVDTPEIDGWIKAGDGANIKKDVKGKGKVVGFQQQDQPDDASDLGSSSSEAEAEQGMNKENEFEFIARERLRQRENGLQVSPLRPSVSQHASMSAIPSPLRSGLGSSGSAHDLLKSIVRDVMYDYQKETKADLRGLHLDLIRAGRGWRKELKEVMEEYVDDLKELREENKRLREENERLRRGY